MVGATFYKPSDLKDLETQKHFSHTIKLYLSSLFKGLDKRIMLNRVAAPFGDGFTAKVCNGVELLSTHDCVLGART